MATEKRLRMEVARLAKEAGNTAFRTGRFADSFAAYARGIDILYGHRLPISDFGLLHASQPLVMQLGDPDAVRLAAMLLCNRAAAALRLKPPRVCRALMDSLHALNLEPGPKPAFRRAQALCALGACSHAIATLAPYAAAEPALMQLIDETRRRAAAVPERVLRLAAQPGSIEEVPPSLAFIGPIALRSLAGHKRRGWHASETIEAGTLLLVERHVFPLAPPETIEEPLPLYAAVAKCLGGGGVAADGLRDLIECMHPLRGGDGAIDAGADLPMARDRAVASRVAAAASASGVPLDEARHAELVIQRNQMALRQRCAGELVEGGVGLFPLASLCNHSCSPNAFWQPISGGRAMVVRACRPIRKNEEVLFSYCWLSSPGFYRRSELLSSHGFECGCERCCAPPGSALHERERHDMALVCPASPPSVLAKTLGTTAAVQAGHLLLPDDPYKPSSGYGCQLAGCAQRLSAQEAADRLRSVHASLAGGFPTCGAAAAAEASAALVLGPRHHAWLGWSDAAIHVADAAEDEGLLLRAYACKEAMLVRDRAADDDVLVRVTHALYVGLESADGVAALRGAYELDRLAFGSDVPAFVARWMPTGLDGVAELACQVLQPGCGGHEVVSADEEPEIVD